MKHNQKIVAKNSEEKEFFSEEKLRASLHSCGATNKQADLIIKQLNPQIYNGISTDEIYKKAFLILKKIDRSFASRYSLKRALFALGPTGYPFERLIGALLREKGYKTEVGVVLQGNCVTHEIDVLAEKDGNVYVIECKFHSDPNTTSNVKVPLYINSRFLDVQHYWNSSSNITRLKQGWLITNTRFTKDAIEYGNCIGLTLLSWDYPKGNSIKTNIDNYGLYPVTALTTLSKKEKQQLISTDIILIKELYTNLHVLQGLNISTKRIQQTKIEIGKLLHIDNFSHETIKKQ